MSLGFCAGGCFQGPFFPFFFFVCLCSLSTSSAFAYNLGCACGVFLPLLTSFSPAWSHMLLCSLSCTSLRFVVVSIPQCSKLCSVLCLVPCLRQYVVNTDSHPLTSAWWERDPAMGQAPLPSQACLQLHEVWAMEKSLDTSLFKP